MPNIDIIWNEVLAWSPRIVGALLFMVVGFWVANKISSIVASRLKKSHMDADLIPFFKSMITTLLKIFIVITTASILSIEITAFAALLAGAGLAIGAALSGTLGHFASGVMILLFKPYKIGDLVEIQDIKGHVEEIQIFNTIIHTVDHKKVVMPNGIATSGVMTNLSATGKLRVDLTVAMPYEEDFDKIKAIITAALMKVEHRLDDVFTVEIAQFGESNVVLDVMLHANDKTYWDVYYQSYKEIKKALADAKIRIPYPVEMEGVHV